jgi:hypothetical protein
MGMIILFRLFVLIAGISITCFSQSSPDLSTYFKKYIGLSEEQIRLIRSNEGFAKTLPSRVPEEIFVFGAIYIHAKPETYVTLSQDFDRRRNVPGYPAIGEFSSPPQLSDLQGFALGSDEIMSLKTCERGKCPIQMPASSIEKLRRTIDWSSPNVVERINRSLRETMLDRLSAYQREGNRILGAYNDKEPPADIAAQFEYLLSYSKAMPQYLPAFYKYLLSYPQGKPLNVEDSFYWAKVDFGLKPTLRLVHVVTMRGDADSNIAYVIAEKQLYASHYFRTALDMAFCISDSPDPNHPGFYLIKTLGSEQAGLTGFKGSIVRKVALSRSASSLQKSLAAIKAALEQNNRSVVTPVRPQIGSR